MEPTPPVARWLWPFRTTLGNRATFWAIHLCTRGSPVVGLAPSDTQQVDWVAYVLWARQAFCVNGRSFPCAAGILGGGKVGILVLDFHFSTAHSFSSFLIFLAYKQQQTTGFFEGSARRGHAGALRQRAQTPRWRISCNPASLPADANASCGTRSPSRIAKRCNAAFQFCTGMVHFLAICSSARNSNFSAASAVGNDPVS